MHAPEPRFSKNLLIVALLFSQSVASSVFSLRSNPPFQSRVPALSFTSVGLGSSATAKHVQSVSVALRVSVLSSIAPSWRSSVCSKSMRTCRCLICSQFWILSCEYVMGGDGVDWGYVGVAAI